VIDLHTHTTASDGRCTPQELVARATAAGVTVLSVTDHDTVAACDAVRAACAAAGIEFASGIEMTAVRDEADVHVLGYFLDPQSVSLQTFLSEQRQRRIDRVGRMIVKLADHGLRLDADAILRPAIDDPARSVGRPWIARALVAAGYVKSSDEAFALWLSRGRPGFVAREGASPEEVIARIHDAGGIASMAHPGLLNRDGWITGFVDAGMDAIEAHHTEHDREATARYRTLAQRLAVGITGGSDYHADESHGASHPGATSLPREDYERLKQLTVRLKPDTTSTAGPRRP
jgi:predicted metal-dependent phosphoesterase TrpH